MADAVSVQTGSANQVLLDLHWCIFRAQRVTTSAAAAAATAHIIPLLIDTPETRREAAFSLPPEELEAAGFQDDNEPCSKLEIELAQWVFGCWEIGHLPNTVCGVACERLV